MRSTSGLAGAVRGRRRRLSSVGPALLLVAALAGTASCSSDGKPAAAPSPPMRTDAARPLRISPEPITGPACVPAEPNGSILIKASCVDPDLDRPYVNVDEQRSTTDPTSGATVSYRYVSGGFRDSEVEFSFYFPKQYQGRFFQYTYPTLSVAAAPANDIAFAVTHHAYLVMSNNGGGLPRAGAIGGVRANAAAAMFSRTVAAQVYADSARPRGYIYGASGGGYQSIGALENTDGVWDGGVPMVPGTPNSIPTSQVIQLLARRVLADKLPRIADAMEPGGSGDPFAGLTGEQREVLREVTRQGYPLRGWWDHENLTNDVFKAVAGGVRVVDPTYADDFWTKPGYAGTDPASSVGAARVQTETTVATLAGTPAEALTLSGVPAGDLTGSDLVILTGAAAGKTLQFVDVDGTRVTLPAGTDAAVSGALRPGDRVRIDNSWYLALQYYARHQVPSDDQYGWNQYRDANGEPRYPQRPVLAGPVFAGAASGAVPTGRFRGKMIMLATLLDTEALPWSADWYHGQAKADRGAKLDDAYRLWFMDNAWHGATPTRQSSIPDRSAETHVVGYWGELQQALLYLDAWVTDGTPPPAGSSYEVDGDSQVSLPASAASRRGVQPTASLTIDRVGSREVDDAVSADARAGEEIAFTVTGETPANTGEIVRVEWDFAGTGDYADGPEVDPDGSVRLSASHVYDKPGTYFAAVRVTSERDGDQDARFALVQNLARVRVVVR